MLTNEDKEYLSAHFEKVNQKIDLLIDPLKNDVAALKINCDNHTTRIVTLENFKEGHQLAHNNNESKKRFKWEIAVSILAGSGILGLIIIRALSAIATAV